MKPPRARRLRRIALAIIEREGKYLVQRRWSTDALVGLWEFPGGKIEPTETPQIAAEREALEELGLEVSALRVLGVVRHDYGDFEVELHVVDCSASVEAVNAIYPARAQWFTLDELSKFLIPPANHALLALLKSPR